MTTRPLVRVFLAICLVVLSGACSRGAPDATPEGAVRLWLEKMESAGDDSRAMREAYLLLGPRARANLKERADRASRGQGRRFEPHEMLAEGRFGLRFRPKAMTSRIEGDEAFVDVRGDRAEETATVRLIREEPSATREPSASREPSAARDGGWRVEPDLPDVAQPARRGDGGS